MQAVDKVERDLEEEIDTLWNPPVDGPVRPIQDRAKQIRKIARQYYDTNGYLPDMVMMALESMGILDQVTGEKD
jgi:hypothetical protein